MRNKFGRVYYEEAGTDGEAGGGGHDAGGDSGGDNGGDAGNNDWRASLNDDYKTAPALQSYKDLNSLVKSHLELESLRGQSIRIPTAEAGDDAWDAFYGKLQAKVPNLTAMPNPDDEKATKAFWAKAGVPEDATGYALPEGVAPEVVEGLNEVAQAAGLTTKQFQALAKEMATKQGENLEVQRAEHKEAMDNLFYQWGMAKDTKLNAINLLLKNSDAPETLKEAVATGNVGADFLAWADGLVKSIGSEGNNLTVDQTQGGGALTPAEAQNQINEIMANKKGAYWNNRDPMHKVTIQKVLDLKRAVIAGQKRAS